MDIDVPSTRYPHGLLAVTGTFRPIGLLKQVIEPRGALP